MKDILNSHPVSVLKKEISKTNIKGYSKMKKAEVIELMMKNKDRFSHIKMAEKKERRKPEKKPEKKEESKEEKKEAKEGEEKKDAKEGEEKKEAKEDAPIPEDAGAAIGLASSTKPFALNSFGMPMHFNDSFAGDNFFGNK